MLKKECPVNILLALFDLILFIDTHFIFPLFHELDHDIGQCTHVYTMSYMRSSDKTCRNHLKNQALILATDCELSSSEKRSPFIGRVCFTIVHNLKFTAIMILPLLIHINALTLAM